MALQSYALTLVDDLRDELCVGDESLPDGRAERLINAASREFMRLAGGRDFERTSALVHDVAGYGTAHIIAPRAPVVSITSITLLDADDGSVESTYDANTYRIEDADAGLVLRSTGWPWTASEGSGIRGGAVAGSEIRLIRLTYTAGWITPYQASADYPGGSLGTRDLPEDIETAVLMAAASLYHSSGRDRSIVKESLGRASVSYSSGAGSSPASTWMPPEAAAIASAYWRDTQ